MTISKDIVSLYILALKHKIELSNIPKAWEDILYGKEDPWTTDSDLPPGYVKMIIKYGKKD